MINNAIARRYAKALVQLGSEDGLIDLFRDELSKVDSLFKANSELRAAFADPVLTLEQKKSIMKELAGKTACSELVGNFLLLLVDKNRNHLTVVQRKGGLDDRTDHAGEFICQLFISLGDLPQESDAIFIHQQQQKVSHQLRTGCLTNQLLHDGLFLFQSQSRICKCGSKLTIGSKKAVNHGQLITETVNQTTLRAKLYKRFGVSSRNRVIDHWICTTLSRYSPTNRSWSFF